MAESAGARPQGVTILAILSFIGGGFGILGSIGIVLGGALLSTVAGPLGGLVSVVGLATLAISAVQLVLGYGFWTLKPWAWQLGFVLTALNLVLAVLALLSSTNVVSFLISLAIAGVIIFYLDAANVRAAFNARASGFPIVGGALDPLIARVRSRI
jgi:hypothetical protein